MIATAKPALRITEGGRCSECGKLQVRFDTDRSGELVEIADPCVHFRARRAPPEPKPEPRIPLAPPMTAAEEEKMAAAPKKLGADEMKDQIRAVLAAQPELRQSDARRTIEERTGCAEINPGTFSHHWHIVREELGLGAAPKAPAKPRAQDKKAEKPAKKEEKAAAAAAGDVQFSEAIHGTLEDVRSLRATYEAGEYIRLEEQDGEWVLSARMAFPDAEAARRALGRLVA